MDAVPSRFAPRFRSTYMLTITSYQDEHLCGQLYTPQLDRRIPFDNLLQLLLLIEELLDRNNTPQRGMDLRMFQSQDAGVLLQRTAPPIARPPLASFTVTILFRQNATWQGTILWADRQLESHFRSALELISLMDGALTQALSLRTGEP